RRVRELKRILQRMAAVCFFSSRRRLTRFSRDWSSDVCSSDLEGRQGSGHPRQAESAASNASYLASPFRVWGERWCDLRNALPPRSEERRVGKESEYQRERRK